MIYTSGSYTINSWGYYYYSGKDVKFLNKIRNKFGIIVVFLHDDNYTSCVNSQSVSYYDERKMSEVLKVKELRNRVLVSYYYYTKSKGMVALNYLDKYGNTLSYKDFKNNFIEVNDLNLKKIERQLKIQSLNLG